MTEQQLEEQGSFGLKGGTKAGAFMERAFLPSTLSQRNRELTGGERSPGRRQEETFCVLQGNDHVEVGEKEWVKRDEGYWL